MGGVESKPAPFLTTKGCGTQCRRPQMILLGRVRLSRWAGEGEAGGGVGFGGTIIERGVVHVAAEEFVLCADDDSLSCRSSADDVSGWRQCVSL